MPEPTPESTEEPTVEPQEGEASAEDTEPTDEAQEFDPTRALEKIRKLNSENKNLREGKRAAEEKAASVGDKDQQIDALKAELLRVRVGTKHGLPDELISRLQGTSEEEILADAEKLLAVIGGNKPPSPRPTTNLRGGGEPDSDPEPDVRKIVDSISRGL